MEKTSKLWFGLGVCASVCAASLVVPAFESSSLVRSASAAAAGGEEGEKGPADAPGEGDFPGDLGLALRKLLAGEGGEGGLGLSTMWPRVTAPALTGKQIRTVVTGNTLRTNEHHALYFTADQAEGWFATWSKGTDPKACPKTEVRGDNYYLSGDSCWLKKVTQVSGPWSVRDHMLCAKIDWDEGVKDPCWHVVLLLDRVALFKEDGKLDGKSNDLKRGKVLPQVLD